MDPHEHFTKEQIDVLKDIHHAETNKLLVRIISANLITIVFAVGAVATGWYRLGHLEKEVATVVVALKEDPRFTQEEGNFLKEHSDRRDDELQRQIDVQKDTSKEIRESVNRIEDKLDKYIFGR